VLAEFASVFSAIEIQRELDNAGSMQAYLDEYQGEFAALAEIRLKELADTAEPAADPVTERRPAVH
jgi:hypothetical protein